MRPSLRKTTKTPSKFPKNVFEQKRGNFPVTLIDNIHSRMPFSEDFGIECWGPDSVEKIVTTILGIFASRVPHLVGKVKFYTLGSAPINKQKCFVQRKPEDAVLFVLRMSHQKHENVRLFASTNLSQGIIYGYPYNKHGICSCKMTMKINPLCEGCKGLDPELSNIKCDSWVYRGISCTRHTQIKDSHVLGERPPQSWRFICEGCDDSSDDEMMEEEEKEREPYGLLTTRKYYCDGCMQYIHLNRHAFKHSKWDHDTYRHKCRKCGEDSIEIDEEELPI